MNLWDLHKKQNGPELAAKRKVLIGVQPYRKFDLRRFSRNFFQNKLRANNFN